MFFDYFKEIYEDIALADNYSRAGLIFRGNFIIWIAVGDIKHIHVIDISKKIVYALDSLPIKLSTARVVTEDRELLLLSEEISNAYLKFITKEVPPNPQHLPKDGTKLIPGTSFSLS